MSMEISIWNRAANYSLRRLSVKTVTEYTPKGIDLRQTHAQVNTPENDTACFVLIRKGYQIHESDERPFLRIGEIKYRKHIDRVIKRDTMPAPAARCALVSMNSTVRSNLTVGPPIDLLIYETGSLNFTHQLCLTEEDPFSKQLSEAWNKGLVAALDNLPRFYWESSVGNSAGEPAASTLYTGG